MDTVGLVYSYVSIYVSVSQKLKLKIVSFDPVLSCFFRYVGTYLENDYYLQFASERYR